VSKLNLRLVKMRFRILSFIFLVFFIVSAVHQLAAESPHTRILFVLDASGSMKSKWENTTRMAAAKKILINLVDSLKDIRNVEIALRCYGFQNPVSAHDCKDTKLVVGFHTGNASEIIKFVEKVQPNGYTPIAYSLTQAASDFPDGNGKNVVILITDGIEECDGDPCAVSKQLQSRNIILRPYIVGIGIDEQKMKFFECVGKYYLPQNEKDLGQILSNVVSQAVNNTTVTVRLLDSKGEPTQTDAEMCFTNAKTGVVEYNFYHTMTDQGKPDTFSVDPSTIYNLQVNSNPPVYKKGISLLGAQNNVINVPAPMGYLNIKSSSLNEYYVQCIVRKAGESDIVNVQSINTFGRYLIGKYDVDILVLPRISLKNISINQDSTTALHIPESGDLELAYPNDVIGQLFVKRSNNLEFVMDINGAGTVRRAFLNLQPGNYSLVYRSKDSQTSTDTKESDFTIISGGSQSLSLR